MDKNMNSVYDFSMQNGTLRKFLPKEVPGKKSMVQGRVLADLVNRVRKKMKKEKVSWSSLLTACLMAYLDEK